MPRVQGAEVTFVGHDPIRPISAGGIGDLVFERNLFRSRYRLIARRPGTLTVPPFSARVGEENGASPALVLTVRPLPAAGRTADFLGGVGWFEVEARADPPSVRLGQVLDFRITVHGPGARGMSGAPGLARLVTLPVALPIERGPDQAVDDPPSRTFVYRLRPTRAGNLTLPPIALAAFDPKSGRYVTKVTAGLPIRVAEVPAFQPGSLRYGPPTPVTAHRPAWVRGFVGRGRHAFGSGGVRLAILERPGEPPSSPLP